MQKLKVISLVWLLLVLLGCNNEANVKPSVTNIVSGNDTIVVTNKPNGYLDFNVSKAHGTSGHNDTLTGITTIKFTNSFKKDTSVVHNKADELFKKRNTNTKTVHIKQPGINISSVNQTGGVTALEINNNH